MTSRQIWILIFWDLFIPEKRKRWSHAVKEGMSGKSAFEKTQQYGS